MEQSDLVILNDGSYTWSSVDGSTRSALDLSLASPTIANIATWQVLNHNYGSDHYPTFININTGRPEKVQCRPHYNTSKTNWDIFKEEMNNFVEDNNEFNPNNLCLNHSSAYDSLMHYTKDALLTARCKTNKSYSRRPPVYWWNAECSEITAVRREAYQRFKAHPCIENIKAYQEICKKTKKQLSYIKKSKYKEFCNSLNIHSDSSRTWKIVKSFDKSKNKTQDGSHSNEDEIEKARIRFREVAPPGPPPPVSFTFTRNIKTSEHTNDQTQTRTDLQPLTEAFHWQEFIISLKHSCSKNSAPGPDLITYKIINKFPQKILQIIFKLFNSFYQKGVYPPAWRTYTMIFIAKPNSNDLRPISMSCNLLKIFERIVKKTDSNGGSKNRASSLPTNRRV